jgi:hypothetical protein
LGLLAPGINKSMLIDGARVRLEASVSKTGARRVYELTFRWPDGVDPMPDWRVDDVADHVLATALTEARFRARYPGTYVDREFLEADFADEPTADQRAVIRDRHLQALADYDDAYRVVKRKPRVTADTLAMALDAYDTGGIPTVMEKLGRSERSAYRIVAQARKELGR